MAELTSAARATAAEMPSARKPVSEPIIRGLAAAYDVAIIFGSGALAYAMWLINKPDAAWGDYAAILIFGSLIALNVFRMWGVYEFDSLLQPSSSLRRVTTGWACVAVTLIAIGFLTKYSEAYSRVWSTVWFATAWSGLVAGRLVLYARSRTWIEEGRLSRDVAVIGLGPIARRLIDHFGKATESGVRVVGIFDDDETQGAVRPPKSYAGRPVLGDLEALERFVRQHPLDTVIIAVSPTEEERLLTITAKLKTLPVNVRLCPGLMGFHLPHASFSHFGDLPLLNVLNKPLSDWQSVLKDVEDRVASALILAMISPVMLGIAALIKFDSPGPVLFRQKRYGFNNQLIDVYKFRTMYNDQRDENAEQLTRRGDPRITKIGATLRKYSLDELPQFLNVVRGEMSIVGPRPHALSAKAAGRLYDEAVRDYASRHRVKPGITGWAQVNGWRGETETLEQIRKRVEYDLVYIEEWSLWLDIKIIWMTVLGGFTGKNAF
ncbi:MAG TPA: undecaprenyl-phosphate glucose phosphotransferase [Parvibaculum sp.]|jgi:Undecaprenyl-phosphate glucose phosphotransferase